MNKFLLLFLSILISFIISLNGQIWEAIDSVSLNTRIPANGKLYIFCDYIAESLYVVGPPSGVIQLAKSAKDYAPDWLKIELEDNFSRLDSTHQDLYANMILNTQDPYVDEVSFCIAHLAPQILMNSQFDPNILLENAEYLYINDSSLDYVTIIDSNSASIGGNYYSTTRYRVYENGDTTEYYLPMDIYYWFVVHPKLQEELPTYIDPVSGSPMAPPTGKFWRNYLFNNADAGYSLLKDTLSGFRTLWNCKKDSLETNGALGQLSLWINTVLPWGSAHSPRLPQPVYLYHWHTGTCSEHGWFSNGAARAALIPATLTVAYRNNHKFNEFWERLWMEWEPINHFINHPETYENWSSIGNFRALFNWRGDGYIWTVTERYTPVCTLRVHISDAEGNSVDGARIIINGPGSPGPWATVGWTTSSGDCQFLLGDSISYFTGAVQSTVGNVSATTIINNSQANMTYYWNPMLSDTIQQLKVIPDTFPSSPLDAYKIEYTIEMPNEIQYGTNPIDGNTFSDFSHFGNIDFFICDSNNFGNYAAGDSFFGFKIDKDIGVLSDSFIIPTAKNWYIILSNEDQIIDKVVANVTVRLFKDLTGINEIPEKKDTKGFKPTLNPATNRIKFSYQLSSEGKVSLSVYDIRGCLVKNLINKKQEKGYHSFIWNIKNIPCGVYFYRFQIPNNVFKGKFVIIQ